MNKKWNPTNQKYEYEDGSEVPKAKITPNLALQHQCNQLKELLLTKNTQYGSSAFEPLRIFSRAHAEEQIKVRMDDKLSRLARGNDSIEADEDVIRDLAGYCMILLAIRQMKANE